MRTKTESVTNLLRNSALKKRQPSADIYKRAEGFSIPAFKIDGNDAPEVYKTAGQAAERARCGEGPSFIQCETYRLTDHHGTKTGVESGYRNKEELDLWIDRCPIRKMEKFLISRGILNEDNLVHINESIDEKISEAFDYAKTSPLPLKNELLKDVYC